MSEKTELVCVAIYTKVCLFFFDITLASHHYQVPALSLSQTQERLSLNRGTQTCPLRSICEGRLYLYFLLIRNSSRALFIQYINSYQLLLTWLASRYSHPHCHTGAQFILVRLPHTPPQNRCLSSKFSYRGCPAQAKRERASGRI